MPHHTTSFMEYFVKEYQPQLGVREGSFLRAFMALQQGRSVIVETGCARKPGNWLGDGQSTVMFDKFVQMHKDSELWSVDIDPEALKQCRTSLTSQSNTLLVLGDSVNFLHHFKGGITLLYLDSFDLDNSNPLPAQQHCLMELCAAMPKLFPGSLVLIDDTTREASAVSGKGALVAQYMTKIGAKLLAFGYQDLWQMP